MALGDPQDRKARLGEVLEIISESAGPEDRGLALSFAPLVFQDMPVRIALNLPAEAVAARIMSHFHFVAREMPPSHQLYHGLPGIHVAVWNPEEETAWALGGGAGLPV